MLIFSQNKKFLIDSNVFLFFEIDEDNAIWANSDSQTDNIENICLGEYLDEKTAVKELERLAEALAEDTEKIFRFS